MKKTLKKEKEKEESYLNILVSFLELEKRKLFLNIMLNTKRRREGEDILACGGEEKIMSL
jgi:hypothetical protein